MSSKKLPIDGRPGRGNAVGLLCEAKPNVRELGDAIVAKVQSGTLNRRERRLISKMARERTP